MAEYPVLDLMRTLFVAGFGITLCAPLFEVAPAQNAPRAGSRKGAQGAGLIIKVIWSVGYTPVTPTGDQPATAVRSWALNIFTKRSEIAEKNVKSMTPCSFIVAHSTLLTRSHCDHLRFRCDSSTLSTHSLRSQCVCNMRTALALRFLRPHQSIFFFW